MRFKIIVLAAIAAVSCRNTSTGSLLQHTYTPEEVMSDWDRMSGNNAPYPDTASVQTPPPGRYKPFYINRMTRHGSRYLSTEAGYDNFRTILEDALGNGVLTDTGKEILDKYIPVCDDAKGRTGVLQELGRQEHRNMIDRMVQDFPEVFRVCGKVKAEAISTAVPRAIESLYAGTDRLRELVPDLDIMIFPGDSAIHFSTAHHGKYKTYRTVRKDYKGLGDAARIRKMLFTDSSFLDSGRDSLLLYDFWMAAVGCRLSRHLGVDLFPYLEKEEIYPLWKKRNATFALTYGENSRSPLDYTMIFDRMLRQMDNAVDGTGDNVDLNYGHDANLMSLTRLMALEPCCIPIPEGNGMQQDDKLYYWDFDVSPMGGNVTVVFYRRSPHDNDVLVKLLLNEKEVRISGLNAIKGVYYRWSELRPFWKERRDIASARRDFIVVDDM